MSSSRSFDRSHREIWPEHPVEAICASILASLRPEDRVLGERLIELLSAHGGNVTAVV
jgi:hypothetical protein